MRPLALILALACVSAPLLAAEPPAPPPKARTAQPLTPPPRTHRLIVRPWMLPPYLLLGLPRDLLDAPSKGLSSIPIFNRIFMIPLMFLNTLTTTLSWSFTDDRIEGGYAAWIDCLNMPRKKGSAPHTPMPAHLRYGPNWRTFGTVYWKPIPPPKPPAGPQPAP